MGRSWGGEGMSGSSHHHPHTDQGKHSGSLRCVIGLNWIRRRREEALLMNDDLGCEIFFSSVGESYGVAVGAS